MVPETGLEPVRFIKPRDFLTNYSFRCHLNFLGVCGLDLIFAFYLI